MHLATWRMMYLPPYRIAAQHSDRIPLLLSLSIGRWRMGEPAGSRLACSWSFYPPCRTSIALRRHCVDSLCMVTLCAFSCTKNQDRTTWGLSTTPNVICTIRYLAPQVQPIHLVLSVIGFKSWRSVTSSWWSLRSPSAKLSIESGISEKFGSHPQATPVVVAIPRTELAYSEWCGTLDIEEWRRWHQPRLDLVIVTNDRPSSLRRLLLSLKTSVFFGDRVNLHINVEQTADPETREIVHSLNWTNGDIIVRHRVILGGLLPAIVESWYPSSNDSYGLILEDDVEVSPMFYAWTKMALLRYRYGPEVHLSNHLFGISLYQQKIIELRPEGRRPFDPRKLFEAHKLTFPDTPYTSQIPCSWGAVYFPEHWREFHSYLIDRLSERKLAISDVIVPDIRSNRWTKSWKKYFIELVYLRGYVMLYPNFAHFISLSTNHLEMGVHVRGDMSAREFLRKKALFDLPLMPLPQELKSGDTPSILDLPLGSLPRWESLPVVDLWGHLSSGEDIVRTGQTRHQHLMPGCPLAESICFGIRREPAPVHYS
ncbi:hypothetical protein BS47DRAFT_381485 [Hydnum rufescens UP504]|uniref:Glycosyltransferase family 2 protein n=1 Tax=Hydnum rufescens UP504 TaxID=1448309 RepID=A0A9P6DMC3_9AGAM|nr:hypothetical protein BS47DRAFT_381485 [Hydnum rufescens UP504]